jgi:hypothetical protein
MRISQRAFVFVEHLSVVGNIHDEMVREYWFC